MINCHYGIKVQEIHTRPINLEIFKEQNKIIDELKYRGPQIDRTLILKKTL